MIRRHAPMLALSAFSAFAIAAVGQMCAYLLPKGLGVFLEIILDVPVKPLILVLAPVRVESGIAWLVLTAVAWAIVAGGVCSIFARWRSMQQWKKIVALLSVAPYVSFVGVMCILAGFGIVPTGLGLANVSYAADIRFPSGTVLLESRHEDPWLDSPGFVLAKAEMDSRIARSFEARLLRSGASIEEPHSADILAKEYTYDGPAPWWRPDKHYPTTTLRISESAKMIFDASGQGRTIVYVARI